MADQSTQISADLVNAAKALALNIGALAQAVTALTTQLSTTYP